MEPSFLLRELFLSSFFSSYFPFKGEPDLLSVLLALWCSFADTLGALPDIGLTAVNADYPVLAAIDVWRGGTSIESLDFDDDEELELDIDDTLVLELLELLLLLSEDDEVEELELDFFDLPICYMINFLQRFKYIFKFKILDKIWNLNI